MDNERIIGGYYIKARQIQESTIMKRPPVVREVWDWILRECNHKEVKHRGRIIKRGQCVRSVKDIRDGLSWMVGYATRRYSEQQTKRAMKVLTNDTMINTTRTTRGFVITVLNYDLYQNPANYERQTNDTTSDTTHDTMVELGSNQGRTTINKNDKKEKKVKNEKNKEYIHSIVSYLNEKVGCSYQPTTENTIGYINGRLGEGYTVADFKTVIDFKTLQWLGDTEYGQYLRPKTLFIPANFESYLNAAKTGLKDLENQKAIDKLLGRE